MMMMTIIMMMQPYTLTMIASNSVSLHSNQYQMMDLLQWQHMESVVKSQVWVLRDGRVLA